MKKKTPKKDIEYEVGSSNVFADLGLSNPEGHLLKAQLASLIYDLIEERGWTQEHTAKVLGITQPDVSKLTRGILKDFSVERLLYFLSGLTHRVAITISKRADLPPEEIVIEVKVKAA